MNNELSQILSEFLSGKFIYYTKIFLISLLAILWIFSISYVIKDGEKRITDKFTKILLIILVIISGPIGLIIHVILRPSETRDEKNQRKLEKVLFLKEFQTNLCPFCSSVIEKDYIFCPDCSKQVVKKCPNCGNLKKIQYKTCPYCGNND